MTAGEAIAAADALRPNQYSTAQKLQWLRRLDAQTKEYPQNPALLFSMLARQEGLITVWELTDMFWQRQKGMWHWQNST